MRSKTKFPIVEIVWDDHFFDDKDKSLEEIIQAAQRPYQGHYVGYLVHETKDLVVLCANVWQDGELSCPMFIVKKLIVSRSDKK